MKTFEELKALIDERGVHEVFGSYGAGFGIEQNSAELAEFLVVCQDLGVSSVLEIGTGYKAGLARFLHDDLGWRVTSVDIQDYGHQFGGITFINGLIDGFEYPVFQEQFDLVLIDGDHTYEAVLFDHDYYGKYATKVIAFHDIAGLRDCEGVRRYWQEISYAATVAPGYYEIIADTPERGGIGYIVLSEVQQTIEFSGDASYAVDPDSSGTVTHEVSEWEIAKPSNEPAPTPKKLAPKPKTTPRKRAPAKKPASTAKTKK